MPWRGYIFEAFWLHWNRACHTVGLLVRCGAWMARDSRSRVETPCANRVFQPLRRHRWQTAERPAPTKAAAAWRSAESTLMRPLVRNTAPAVQTSVLRVPPQGSHGVVFFVNSGPRARPGYSHVREIPAEQS